MSKLNKDALRKMILSEMKMLGMAAPEPMGMMGGSHDAAPEMMVAQGHAGSVSREDCCAAVMCMVECCSCPVTKAALMECCADLMSGHYDK